MLSWFPPAGRIALLTLCANVDVLLEALRSSCTAVTKACRGDIGRLMSRVVHTKQYAGIDELNLPADHRTPSIYCGAEEYYNQCDNERNGK
ncbi:hypothetical protein PHET_08128 [Paragonimus heterotremus]|uniref:Uncharacterized protein n=1 Tax=Paragonimus heterotremus TaxID=100268 RepID=A0A8J4WFJ2_9TREM|nr:hypothetical protein PHET_08128 [Paragonimus heterotremus]